MSEPTDITLQPAQGREDLNSTMSALKEVIQEATAPRPFLLLVHDPHESDEPGGRVCFVTNCHMPDMIEAMREFIETYEALEAAKARGDKPQ